MIARTDRLFALPDCAAAAPRRAGDAVRGSGRWASATLAAALLLAGPLAAQEEEDAVRRSTGGRDATIIAGEDRVVYEYRVNGVLRQIRIVPDNGRPYYLVPADPTRAGQDLSTAGRLVPSWKLIEF